MHQIKVVCNYKMQSEQFVNKAHKRNKNQEEADVLNPRQLDLLENWQLNP
jgi:hypothetical protein